MQFYDEIAKGYEELHGEEQRRKMRLIHALLDEHGICPKSVLDIGCGTGISMEGFENCIGIDPSFKLLKKNPAYNIVQGKGQELPFKNKTFDLILSVTALHHMKPYESALAEIKRVGRRWILFSLLHQTKDILLPLIKQEFHVISTEKDHHDIILLCQLKSGE